MNDDGSGGTAEPLTGWRLLLSCLTVLGVVLALLFGLAWAFLGNSGYWPGSSMTTAWETPVDRAAFEHGENAWLAGDTLVRSRFDAVTGFDAGSGKQRWEYVPPRRTDICATSSAATSSVVLIAYGERAKGCAMVAALGLKDGRELWHTARTPATDDFAHQDDVVATGVGLGVVLDGGKAGGNTVRALDLRTGAPRWTAAVPKGCVPGKVAAAPKQVLAMLACGTEAKLAALDPADGRARWTVPLDARRGVDARANVAFTSTEPIVLRVDEVGAFLAFGPDGRPRGRIESTGAHGSIGGNVAVSDGRLFALTDGGSWGLLVAFDLATGGELWRTDLGSARSKAGGLHAESGRVMAVLTSDKYGDNLYVYNAATGDEEEDRAFRERIGGVQDLFPYKDLVIGVRTGGSVQPFSAYKRW
ncbi:PQQ-binding-like beta-propeller repeat protein [Streptomyces sp. NPDC059637]|uniref:outer membrane protein assembly factor BamB family protein n=1 Tax=Streptomyces TaxID=1883 RepID=UPI0031D118CA